MASFPFEIEFVDPKGRYVLARSLGPANFRLGPDSRLGEVAVASVSMPRAMAADGTPRLDIFGFKVADPASALRLRVGQTVELRAGEDPAPTGTSS